MPDSLKTEVEREAGERRALFQKGADRITAAQVELAAAIADFSAMVEADTSADAELHAFITAFRNPTVANPEPIAPEVAAPPPAEPPPVFTTVDTPVLTPDTTSGGFAPVIDEAFALPHAAEGETPADGAIGAQGE